MVQSDEFGLSGWAGPSHGFTGVLATGEQSPGSVSLDSPSPQSERILAMKREELIVEISEAIEARIQQLAEADADLWDCYIPGDASRQMARAAVAIMEA